MLDVHGMEQGPGAWALMHDLGEDSSDELVMVAVRFAVGIFRDAASSAALMRRRTALALTLLTCVVLRLSGVTGIGGSLVWLHARSDRHWRQLSTGTLVAICALAGASVAALATARLVGRRVVLQRKQADIIV